jgi:hypothetical protein
MKKTLATIAIAAGIGIGGLSLATSASAESDRGTEPGTEQTEPAESTWQDPVGLIAPQQVDEPVDEPAGDEGREGPEGREGCRRGGRSLGPAADVIGIEVEELRAALDEGQTLADVATANGIDPNAVVDALVSASSDRLAEHVADGEITQEEADERLAEKSERITAKVFGDEPAA